MDANDDRLNEIDRAQLLKVGSASLFGAVAAALSRGQADAAMGDWRSHPFTLDYSASDFTRHTVLAKKGIGLKLKRVRITDDQSKVNSATFAFEIQDPVPNGNDETYPDHPHPQKPIGYPIWVGLWFGF